MKYAGDEIEQHLYSVFGSSFSVDGQTWNYYTNPPQTDDEFYVWTGLDLTNEDGTKDKFLSEFFLEVAVVNRAESQYTSNKKIELCVNHITELLITRGQQVGLTNFNLVRTALVGVTSNTEFEAQTTVLVRKLIFSILAQEL